MSIITPICGVKREQKFLDFIKETRLNSIKKWKSDVRKYQNHLLTEKSEYVIKLKKEEIKRLKDLIKVYSSK
jgi:hypothetical protein